MTLLYSAMLHMHETYVEDVLIIKAIIAPTFFFKAITAIARGNFRRKIKDLTTQTHACCLHVKWII